MKCIIAYNERSSGSALEYEQAQKRVLQLFGKLKFPETFRVEKFYSQVGKWSGFIIADVDDLAAVQKVTSIFPTFVFDVYPVMEIGEAVQAELEAISWRDSIKD